MSTQSGDDPTRFSDLESLSANPWASTPSTPAGPSEPTPIPPPSPPSVDDLASTLKLPSSSTAPTLPPLELAHSNLNNLPPSLPTRPNVDLSEFDPFSPIKSSASSSSSKHPSTTADSTPLLPGSSFPRAQGKRRRKEDGEERKSLEVDTRVKETGGMEQLPPTPKEAPFDFQGFLGQLRGKSAESVAKYLKSFLTNFAKKQFTTNEQIKLIHDFLEFISGKMKLVEPWKSQNDPEFDNAMEAMEKLVMNRLYTFTFTPQIDPSLHPITTDDLERDAVLQQRIRLFGWVREKHLEVPEGDDGSAQGFLAFAEQELLKINHYKAPRDKMICILNCCKVIFGLIRHVSGSDSASADTFLPILIFVVLRANPDHLMSNVEYITRFRSGDKLQGEAGYYLSSLGGAISFIETMDASSLSHITQTEFESSVEAAILDLPPGSPYNPRSPRSPDRPANAPFANTAEGEEPARALTNLPTNIALDTRRFFQRTGELAQGAVQRPLSAIGRLIDNIGPSSEDESSEGDRSPRRSHEEDPRTPARSIQYQPRMRAPQGNRIANLGQQGASPGSGGGWLSRFTGESPTPGAGLAPGLPGVEESPLNARMDFSALPSRNATPAESDDPTFNLSALTAEIDRTHATARQASIQTLHQMFPGLDEEVAGVVLDSCDGDLGGAIDRMLEMAAG